MISTTTSSEQDWLHSVLEDSYNPFGLIRNIHGIFVQVSFYSDVKCGLYYTCFGIFSEIMKKCQILGSTGNSKLI